MEHEDFEQQFRQRHISEMMNSRNIIRPRRSPRFEDSDSDDSNIEIDEETKKLIAEFELEKDFFDLKTFKKIKNCISRKNERLYIKDIRMTCIPKIFKKLTFLKNLIINDCSLNRVNNIPPNIEKLDLDDNEFTEIDQKELPKKLEYLSIQNNNIKKLILDEIEIKKINFSKNIVNVEEIKLNPKVEKLNIEDSEIYSLDFLKDLINLKIIDFSKNYVSDFENIPDNVEEITADRLKNSGSIVIKKLPLSLKEFNCKHSNISSFAFENFPSNLRDIIMINNNLETVPVLPDTLSRIDFERNKLTTLPNIPISLEFIDISGNNFSKKENEDIKNKCNMIGVGRCITDETNTRITRRENPIERKIKELLKDDYSSSYNFTITHENKFII